MPVNFELLIGHDIKAHTKNIVGTESENKLTYYLHDDIGWSSIDRSVNFIENNISIFSTGHTKNEKTFIRNVFKQLDALIDIDFEEMLTYDGSALDIYSVNYSSNFPSNVVGMAIRQTSSGGNWWDIIWKDITGKHSFDDLDKNTLIHEIGHSLGLSHPNEDPFNKQWNTKDTVMSYNPSENGWDTWYSSSDIKALQAMWGREDDDGSISINGKKNEFKLYQDIDKTYSIKTDIGYEDITNLDVINFSDYSLSVKNDIIDVFNLVEDIDGITGQIFRLYNAAFGRFPDKEGFSYWIKMNKSKMNTYKETAASFINSKEYEEHLGEITTNENYITNLYSNLFGRNSDTSGFDYWLNQLNNNKETRADVLMGFSESNENKNIFIDQAGLSA